jgi:hypothetical protein
LAILLRTYLKSFRNAPVKEPSVVYYSPSSGELVGIEGDSECYRKDLHTSAAAYGVNGNYLVIAGDGTGLSKNQSIVTLVNVRSGEILAQKPLNVRINPLLEGVTDSIVVEARKCYFCGHDKDNQAKQQLVCFDLDTFQLEYYSVDYMFVKKVIAVDDDLGFCAPYGVYRFAKPPLVQKNGFDGSELKNPSFFYFSKLGLYNLDVSGGTIAHIADETLNRLSAVNTYSLAGSRITKKMIAVDPVRDTVISASWPTNGKSSLQSLDLAQGKVSWRTEISGAIDELLLNQNNEQLYLLDASARKLRRVDLSSLESTDYATLGNGTPNTIILLWGR